MLPVAPHVPQPPKSKRKTQSAKRKPSDAIVAALTAPLPFEFIQQTEKSLTARRTEAGPDFSPRVWKGFSPALPQATLGALRNIRARYGNQGSSKYESPYMLT
jgi:hypothetical protein